MQNNDVIKRDSGEIFVSVITDWIRNFIRDTKNIDIVQFTGILFIIYSFNSYFGLPMFDSQPFPFLLAVVFLIMRTIVKRGNLKTPTLFISIGLLSALGITMGTYFNFDVNMIFVRGVINYLSVFILMIAFYEYIRVYNFPLKIMVVLNIIWIIVGIIQLFEPELLKYFVASRTSPGRGVTSLGPEPSSYGMQLFFMSWIYLIATDYKPDFKIKLLIFVNILGIFFLAISAITIMFLVVSSIFYFIYNFKSFANLRNLLILIITFTTFILVVFVFLKGSRMEELFTDLLTQNFFDLLQTEGSVNSRLAHQVLPLYLFFSNLGLPAGLQSFVPMVETIDPSIIEILWGDLRDEKIMSWNATLFFEQGLFGVMIWVLLIIFLMDGSLKRVTELLLLFILLFSSIPQSYPLIPMIFVMWFMTNKKYRNRKKILKNSY